MYDHAVICFDDEPLKIFRVTVALKLILMKDILRILINF